MGDRLEHVLPGAVHLGERDEGAAEIVAATRTQLEERQIVVQRLLRLRALSHRHVARGDDEVVGRRRAAVDPLPAGSLPLGQQHVERRMDGDAPWNPGLGLSEVESGERLEILVQVRPAQARRLAVAQSCQRLERVEHAAILKHARIEDQRSDLLAIVDGRGAPVGILVDLLRQDALAEHAWRRRDQLIRHRVPEHDRHRGEDVTDGPRRELVRLAMEDNDIPHVGWPHGSELKITDQRHDVLAQPVRVIRPGRQ
ncbi:MAG: hypothetical protein ABJA82_11655 [Myxococcales bacterium]